MNDMQTILYPCSIDNSMQYAKYYKVKSDTPRPLVVALHTWSGNYQQNNDAYFNWCTQNNVNMIYPNFRGENWNVDGCGSEKVIADIVDAVKFAKEDGLIDENRVYLVGGSGGGHATLLVAGRVPDLWAAASAWCPISDVLAWHSENNKADGFYSKHIESACGGDPSISKTAELEAKKRSPLTYLNENNKLSIDISTGIHDGHTGSVPVSHAINAFNALAKKEDRISEQDIKYIVEQEKIPTHLQADDNEPLLGERKIYLRKISNHARLTIFEGGHDLLATVALMWLEKQIRNSEPNWNVNTQINENGNSELSK